MGWLSNVANTTADWLASTQPSYNEARRNVIRAEMLRNADRELFGAQKYLNPDLEQKNIQQQAADELAAAGTMFTAPRADQSMAFQEPAPAAPIPAFSAVTPSLAASGYDGTVKPAPAAPAFSAPKGLALLTTPLQDSLPAYNPAATDAAAQVEMMTGKKGVQGASVSGSSRASGIDDEAANRIQAGYDDRAKELAALDRQDFLDKARLLILRKMEPQYLERTAGLGGEDEWKAEIDRLETSLAKRQENRDKILVKMQESDQKLLASRSRAASQSASLQLKKDINDGLARARLAMQQSKDRWEGMKIWQKMIQDHVKNALLKYQIDTEALGKNLPSDIINGLAARKAYVQQVLGSAVDRMNQNLSGLRAGAFSSDPDALQKIMAETERDLANSTPVFDAQDPKFDKEAASSFFGNGLTPEGLQEQRNIGLLTGSTADWQKRLGKDSPIVPDGYTSLIGGTPSFSGSFAFSDGRTPQPAPAAAPTPPPKRVDRTKKMPAKGKKLDY